MNSGGGTSRAADSGSLTYLVLICLVATLGGLLFGYDTAVISGAIGFLQTHFQLDPTLKGWAASSALAGCVLGVLGAGVLSDRFGRRNVLIVSAVLFLVSAIGTALPRTFSEFIFYRILGGLGVGAASMASPMYIAEISPAAIRGRMVSVNQLAIVGGMLVVYFVNYFIARLGDEAWNVQSGWRWMFASGAIPSLLLFVLLFFVPESPRFLTKQGRGFSSRTDSDADWRCRPRPGRVGGDSASRLPGIEHSAPALPAGDARRAADRRRVGRTPTDHGHQRVPVLWTGDLQGTGGRRRRCRAAADGRPRRQPPSPVEPIDLQHRSILRIWR